MHYSTAPFSFPPLLQLLGGSLELIQASEELLDTVCAGVLPRIVVEAEEDGVLTTAFQDATNRTCLLTGTRHSCTVITALARPATLQVVGRETGAALAGELELAGDEAAGLVGADVRVEEGLDVGSHDVDDGAERARVLLKDVERLGGRAWAAVASGLERLLRGADESCEVFGAAVAIEDGFVADDAHLDEAPVTGLTPCDDFLYLRLRAANARGFDEYADDHLQAVGLAGGADVLQTRAVGCIESDSLEALTRDAGDVAVDLVGSFALTRGGVWRIGNGPLVAVCGDAAARATG